MKTKTPTIPGNLAFDDVLAVMLPNLKPGLRRKRFTDFLISEIRSLTRGIGEKRPEPDLARIAVENVNVFRLEGLPLGQAEAYQAKMLLWHRSDVSAKRADAARRKAAKAKAVKRAKENKVYAAKKPLNFKAPEGLDFQEDSLQD